ncbi:DUF4013 domain-containing protein [Chloroflexus sp.]|uniref:DUF4013 domain-containing protein n=1 Tax=Chloroflexus sp. TaxID=1904827 RepID=UPI002ADE680E|nr:DUF4013 domain-containing protein [Chloroflexus sp.]
MNVTRAFSFIFDDPDWLKITLVIGLLQFIPVIGQIVGLGCIVVIARAVANGQERPLPQLNQLGALFSTGVYSATIYIVYYLPIFLISCLLSCLVGATIAFAGNSESTVIILIGLMLCSSVVIVPLSLITQILLIVGIGRYIQTGSVSAAFQPGGVWALLQRYPAEWLVLWLLSLLCGTVASVGTFVLLVGLIVSIPYATFVFGHLLGQTVQQVTSSPASPTLSS